MKRITFIAALLFALAPIGAHAMSCCVGGSPKSFISLKRFEKYEFGLSSSFSDTYGYHNVYGEMSPFMRSRSLQMTAGAAMRLNGELQLSAAVPFVYRAAGSSSSTLGLGDVVLGGQYVFLESLFREEWYPTLSALAGVKTPTGIVGQTIDRTLITGTGNGLWEPYVGIGAEKAIGPFTLALRAAYTTRFPRNGVSDGDIIDLTEGLTLPLTARLAITGGSSQSWTFDKKVGGVTLPDSASRTLSAFVSPSFFLTQYLSFAATADFTLPFDKVGVNSPATQTFSVTAKYGIY